MACVFIVNEYGYNDNALIF